MFEDETISSLQLNAIFSVPGKTTYSKSIGENVSPGFLTLTVTFTPDNQSAYLTVSTSRTIIVKERRKSNILPSPSPSPSPPIVVKPKTVKVSELRLIGVIYFNNNEYFLDSRDRLELAKVASIVKERASLTVYIEGNTDVKRGVDNVWLSRSRAESVSNFLRAISKAPTYNRMWWASARPAVPGVSKEALALNRRVEIYIPQEVERAAGYKVEKPAKIEKQLGSVFFNLNDYFLDATDRRKIKSFALQATELKCNKISLIGTRDSTPGKLNERIAFDRIRAVKAFLRDIYPLFEFISEETRISPQREVKVSCSN